MGYVLKIAALPLACLVWSCNDGRREATGNPVVRQDTVSILGDPAFAGGLALKRAGGPPAGVLRPFGPGATTAIWELAEWGSGHMLSEADRTEQGDWRRYANAGKKIEFMAVDGGVSTVMDVYASAEYDHPRKPGQPWPHLLVEQSFPDKPLLSAIDGVMLSFEGKLGFARSRMAQGEYDAGLHAAQFQLFITVQDLDTASARHGDYLWFGIPFYDSRYEQSEVYAAQDVGKDDATGKFIYSMASADFMSGTFHSGDWIRIEKDILPNILNAFALAQDRGYLTGTTIDGFGLTGMNLGWEVPGTFDVRFEIKEFDLSVISDGKE